MRSLHFAVILSCAGIGTGAVIAKLLGTTSWLDAKLYLVAGCALGALAAMAIQRARIKKPTMRGESRGNRENHLPTKACSICGKSFPTEEFAYGNRENRSYCKTCDRGEKAAYSLGGVEAARRFREEARATWKH